MLARRLAPQLLEHREPVASLRGTHWRQNARGGRSRVQNSALSRVLHRPNDYETASSFMLNAVRSLYLEGNCFALALRNSRFEVESLHLMNPRMSGPLVAETGDIFFSTCRQRRSGSHVWRQPPSRSRP